MVALMKLVARSVKQKDYRRGIEQVSRAICMNPNVWQPYSMRGFLYYALGEPWNSIQDGRSADKVAPEENSFRYTFAASLIALGHVEEALTHFRRATKYSKLSKSMIVVIETEIVHCLLRLGKIREADEMLSNKKVWRGEGLSLEVLMVERAIVVRDPAAAAMVKRLLASGLNLAIPHLTAARYHAGLKDWKTASFHAKIALDRKETHDLDLLYLWIWKGTGDKKYQEILGKHFPHVKLDD